MNHSPDSDHGTVTFSLKRLLHIFLWLPWRQWQTSSAYQRLWPTPLVKESGRRVLRGQAWVTTQELWRPLDRGHDVIRSVSCCWCCCCCWSGHRSQLLHKCSRGPSWHFLSVNCWNRNLQETTMSSSSENSDPVKFNSKDIKTLWPVNLWPFQNRPWRTRSNGSHWGGREKWTDHRWSLLPQFDTTDLKKWVCWPTTNGGELRSHDSTTPLLDQESSHELGHNC